MSVLDVGGNGFPAWRIVRAEDPDDPVFLNSLRSNYELGEEPRKVERSSAAVHMGISMYLGLEVAVATAQRWSKLGDYVAEIAMMPGHGFNFAQTGHSLHLTVWADPVKLREAVVGVRPV